LAPVHPPTRIFACVFPPLFGTDVMAYFFCITFLPAFFERCVRFTSSAVSAPSINNSRVFQLSHSSFPHGLCPFLTEGLIMSFLDELPASTGPSTSPAPHPPLFLLSLLAFSPFRLKKQCCFPGKKRFYVNSSCLIFPTLSGLERMDASPLFLRRFSYRNW